MGWVKVSKRLPEEPGVYLTCDEKGNLHVFYYISWQTYPFNIGPKDPRYYPPKWWMEGLKLPEEIIHKN